MLLQVQPKDYFADGYQVLWDYHQCFLYYISELKHVERRFYQQTIASDTNYQQKIQQMVMFLEDAMFQHHKDEELCLFPYLKQYSYLVDGMLAVLENDHRDLEQIWQELAAFLSSPSTIGENERFIKVSQTYRRWLEQHIARENDNFLPEVRSILLPEQWYEIGKKMEGLRHYQGIV